MATDTLTKFNVLFLDMAQAVHDLTATTGDQVSLYMSNTAPVATNTLKGTPAEIADGGGYTAGMAALDLSNWTSSESSGTYSFDADDPGTVITASAAVADFRYVLLYNKDTVAKADPLMGWWDYGSTVSMTTGETFSMTFGDAYIIRIA